MSKRKKAPKASDLLKKALGKASTMGGAFSAPPSPVPDARLNPSPAPAPAPSKAEGKKERRRKTKGMLFRMTPELHLELIRCAYTDPDSKGVTHILTRGALQEIIRIKAKFPEGLKTPPPDTIQGLIDKALGL
jgi:hypothetical protein